MEVRLIEGQFQDMYHIVTFVEGVVFESLRLYSVKEVEEKGFIITSIKDR